MSKVFRYGILASPARHSASPGLHRGFFAESGVNATYDIFDIPPGDLEEFVGRIRREIDGVSVSLPFKEVIIPYLDYLDPAAKEIGAVNTVKNVDGKLYGYNTDWMGSNRALEETGRSFKDAIAVVVGAGGAARAIIYGLKQLGCEVIVVNRTFEKAHLLAEEFGVKSAKIEDLVDIKGEFLIQSSAIWTLNSEAKLSDLMPPEAVGHFEVVMDIIYKPLITPLLEVAEQLGKVIVVGEKMLEYQARDQFRIWRED